MTGFRTSFPLAAVALLLLALMSQAAVLAAQLGPSGLPVPRFVSLKSDHVRMRAGPSDDYRILFEYKGLAGMPVLVIAETENWRKVRDIQGDEGWIHRVLLRQPQRAFVLGSTRQVLRDAPRAGAMPIAYLEPLSSGNLGDCETGWCELRVAGRRGWIEAAYLWGVNSESGTAVLP